MVMLIYQSQSAEKMLEHFVKPQVTNHEGFTIWQPRSQGLSSLPPLVVGKKTLVAAGHVTTCHTNFSIRVESTNNFVDLNCREKRVIELNYTIAIFQSCCKRHIRPDKIYLTNRFHVAMRLFCNRSQMTSKCGMNKKGAQVLSSLPSLVFLPTTKEGREERPWEWGWLFGVKG